MKTIDKEMAPVRPEGGFDSVKMMREIRDEISQETQSMTFEELKAYIKAKLIDTNVRLIGQK